MTLARSSLVRARLSAGVAPVLGGAGVSTLARRARAAALCAIGVVVSMPAAPSRAAVVVEPPLWKPLSLAEPTRLPPSGEGTLSVSATNVGGTTDGSSVTIEDTLPAGLAATAIHGYDAYLSGGAVSEGEGERPMTCSPVPATESPLRCTIEGVRLITGDSLIVRIHVRVGSASESAEPNEVAVSGGGAAPATASNPVVVSPVPAGFGTAPGSLIFATSSSQAGAHASLTTALTVNMSERGGVGEDEKDLRFDLPPGLVGAAAGLPKCSEAKILEQLNTPAACPRASMVGMVTVLAGLFPGTPPLGFTTPLYAIAPAPGESAAFAFDAIVFPVRLDTTVLSGGSYGVRISAAGLSEEAKLFSAWITVWGVPADHDGPPPGEGTGGKNFFGEEFGGPEPGARRVPLLTNPQRCGVPMQAAVSIDSWTNPGVFTGQSVPAGPFTGCEALSLRSSFTMLPTTLEAGAPAGYTLDLDVPQNSEASGLATPALSGLRLTLPLGTVLSPSLASGVSACPSELFGPHSPEPARCPPSAQIGAVELQTPDLPEPLAGAVYLGAPLCGPCSAADASEGRMVRLFVQALAPGEPGLVVKLVGAGSIDPSTGRITATFDEVPPLPFSHLHLTFTGGPRAALANPRACGPATATVDITPWSSPFTEELSPSFAFDISGCSPPRFAPSLTAQSLNPLAGAGTTFTLAFARGDSDEFFAGLREELPPGLMGRVAGVAPCPEPGAGRGECPEGSLIGHVSALTGPGADPSVVGGGKLFLTSAYGGAPFGLSIVLPAVAGPFTLAGTSGAGTLVVRSAVFVDPRDGRLTVASDPLPAVLDGIPLQIRAVSVTIDRPGFMLNPTSCARSAVRTALSSVAGASASVTTPFQVADCAGLSFKPRISASIGSRRPRGSGTSLDVRMLYPSGPAQANVKSVAVQLPRQLPSRLKALQQACLDTVFASDPSRCPSASRVGEVRASTPILPHTLSGPVYFISHGTAAYPDLVVVLSDASDGIRLELVGRTALSSSGTTSIDFAALPDVPIASLSLHFPSGPFALLSARGRLCGRRLTVPTVLTAQNGAVLRLRTRLACVSTNVESRSRSLGRPVIPAVPRVRFHAP